MAPQEYDHALEQDRRNGGMDDPKANMYTAGFHRRFARFSKAELIDLLGEINWERKLWFDGCMERDGSNKRVADSYWTSLEEEMAAVLNARYLNRHPGGTMNAD